MDDYRIVLADDHYRIREGLRSILEEKADFRVVGEASDGMELLFQTITTARPIPPRHANLSATADDTGTTASAQVLSLVPKSRRGLNVQQVVEAMGIEPTTSCMPCKRSTN